MKKPTLAFFVRYLLAPIALVVIVFFGGFLTNNVRIVAGVVTVLAWYVARQVIDAFEQREMNINGQKDENDFHAYVNENGYKISLVTSDSAYPDTVTVRPCVNATLPQAIFFQGKK